MYVTPSRTSQRVQQTNSSMCQCLKFLKKFVVMVMFIPQEHISQQIGEQIVIKPVALQSQSVAVLCFLRCLYAPVSFVSSCQTTFRVSSGFCSFETCAHTKRNRNRRPCSPHVLSLQLDRCNYERCVVLDKCAKNSAALSLLFRAASCGDRGTSALFRQSQFCESWKTLLRMRRDSCEPRERNGPLSLTRSRWPCAAASPHSLERCILHRFWLISDEWKKKGAHATAVCTDPALYVKWDGRTSSKDVCWTSSDWLPWRVSDLLVWSDFCVRNRHLQILLLNTCLTLRLQWQCVRCCIRESRHWYSYARMDCCCHVRRDARQTTTRASHASSSQWSRSPYHPDLIAVHPPDNDPSQCADGISTCWGQLLTKSGKSDMHVVCAPCQIILCCSSDNANVHADALWRMQFALKLSCEEGASND